MRRNKIAALLALLSVCAVGTLASCGGGDKPAPKPEPETPDVPEVKADFTFTGKNTIDDVEYDCTLAGFNKDSKFELKVGTVKTIEGSFVFVDHVGYTFNFTDTSKTVAETTWDAEGKNHVLTYHVALGEAGSGDITLKLNDPDFVFVQKSPREEFIKNAKFTGVLATSSHGSYALTLTFDLNGKFHLDNDKGMNFPIIQAEGDYTYENNTFAFELNGTQFKSEYDLRTGSYVINYSVTMEETVTTQLVYNPNAETLFDSVKALGGVEARLYVYGDHTAFFDVYCLAAPSPAMQVMYDKNGNWSYNEKTNTYTFNMFGNVPTGEKDEAGHPIMKVVKETWTSTYDEAKKEYTVPVTLKGGEQVISFNLTGNFNKTIQLTGDFNSQFGPIKLELSALDDKNARVAISAVAAPSMNGKYNEEGTYVPGMFDLAGTYTVENNVYTFVVKSLTNEEAPALTLTSVWSEEAGTYTVHFSMPGQDFTIETDLVLSVWE